MTDRRNTIARCIKRTEDVVLASAFLLLAAIPMAGIALLLKLSDGGPVFFRQRRVGRDEREIVVWKFRTMAQDPRRVTRLGRYLRSAHLDELPQLVNVLQGRMSLVGPRPHPTYRDREYRRLVDSYPARHRIRPGITGWAQVNGLAGDIDSVDKLRSRVAYDIWYIQHWSLALDLRILARTLWTMIVDAEPSAGLGTESR